MKPHTTASTATTTPQQNSNQSRPDPAKNTAELQAAGEPKPKRKRPRGGKNPLAANTPWAQVIPERSYILRPGTVIIVIVEGDLTPRPAMHTVPGPDENLDTVRAANPDAVSGGQEDEGNPGRPAPQSASHPGPRPMLSMEDLPVCGGSCNRRQLP